MISVDTSVVVRYLVGTPVEQARRAARIIDTEESVGIPVVVLLEAAHVLRTQYGIDRSKVLETMIELVTKMNVETLGLPADAVIEALVRARSLPGSPLPDALVVATARTAEALPLYSFYQGLARHGISTGTP
jgi:predicted nucleic acid-binding protein